MSRQLIGHEPALQRLNLVDGQDLSHAFRTIGDPLPAGTTVELHMMYRDHTATHGVWPVTEVDGTWVVHIEAADHAEIPTGARFRLFVNYPDGGRYCWIAGPVVRSRR